jgi:hypothetical protein
LGKVGQRVLDHIAPELADEHDRLRLEAEEGRGLRRRGLTWTPDTTGGVHMHGYLDPESATTVGTVLDPLCKPRPGPDGERDGRCARQRRADALVQVCTLAGHTTDLPTNGGDRTHLVVTVGYDPLTEALGAGMLGVGVLDTGQHLTPATVRRLACDATILPAVMGGASQPLDLGRERRLITGALRQALILRDHGCVFPGCDRPPRWCHGHHLIPWHQGGETNLSNAALLCGHHHRVVHHHNWHVRLAADGHPELIPPEWIDPERTPRRNTYHRRDTYHRRE